MKRKITILELPSGLKAHVLEELSWIKMTELQKVWLKSAEVKRLMPQLDKNDDPEKARQVIQDKITSGEIALNADFIVEYQIARFKAHIVQLELTKDDEDLGPAGTIIPFNEEAFDLINDKDGQVILGFLNELEEKEKKTSK